MLTKEAFNSLLKTLEEPPNYIKFILATTDPLKLPATILSRTQHFRFKSIITDNIVQHLEYILNKENIQYDNSALQIIARSSNGSLRDTLTILDQAILYSKQNITINSITEMLGMIDPVFLDNLFNTIFQKDIHKLKILCEELDTYSTETVIDEIIIYLKDKLFENNVKYSVIVVDRFFRILNDAKYLLNINANSMFVMILTFLKMIEAIKIKDIDDVIKEYENSTVTKNNINTIEKEHSIISEPSKENIKIEESASDKFKKLVNNIYEINSQIGDCFSQNVKFISFQDNCLTWESNATNENKEILRKNYLIIKKLVDNIYGYDTIIKSKSTIKHVEKEETINEKLAKDLDTDGFIKNSIELLEITDISLIKK
jgi:DNA polymerase-3 subunit gamma/tau